MRHYHSSVMRAVLVVFTLGGNVMAASAQDAYYTSGTYTLDATHSVVNNAYVGEDSSGMFMDSLGNPYSPIVNVVTGGAVGNELDVYNSSRVNISDGSSLRFLNVMNTSQANISGGNLSNNLDALNSSQVNISGGFIGGALVASNSSQVNISGGMAGYFVFAYNTSRVNITGGSIGYIVEDFSTNPVTVSGGTVGKFFGVNYLVDGTNGFTLVGYDLLAVNAGADPNFGGTDYDLSGTLLDGTNLNGYVLAKRNGGSFILQNVNAVPEPGSIALLVSLFTVSAGFVRKRRSRS